MEDQKLFGKYTISDRGLAKLETIRGALKENIYKADSRWKLIARKKSEDTSSESDESDVIEVVEVADTSEEPLPSSQFFFTQVDRSIKTEVLQQTALEICDIIEVLYERLECSMKVDFNDIENLSNNELVQVFTDLGKKLSIQSTCNLCSSIKEKNPEERIKYVGYICTHVLLPKIIVLEESSRLLSSAIRECVETFPDEIIKYIFLPLLNVDLKDASIINIIIDTLQPSKRSVLPLEYATNAKELKEWHISILQTLLSVKVEENIYDKLLSLFLEKAVFYSTNKKFGKLLLSLLKANTITSEEQKSILLEIVEVNETLFKKLIENILKKM